MKQIQFHDLAKNISDKELDVLNIVTELFINW